MIGKILDIIVKLDQDKLEQKAKSVTPKRRPSCRYFLRKNTHSFKDEPDQDSDSFFHGHPLWHQNYLLNYLN